MKFLAIILLIPILAFCVTTTGSEIKLDELLLKSGKIRHNGVQGFILKQNPHDDIQPSLEKSYNGMDLEIHHPTGRGKWVPYAVYINDIHEYDNQINDLKTQIAKVTTVLDNLTENSGSVKGILDATTKILETLAALIAFIGGIIGTLHFSKKKKYKSSLKPVFISREELDKDVDRIIEKLNKVKNPIAFKSNQIGIEDRF
jgi:hypothetical protein